MNHMIHHSETPPGLTPPRLLAGGREGKVLYIEIQYLELRRIKMLEGGGQNILFWDRAKYLYYIISFNDHLGLCVGDKFIFSI